MPYLRRSGQALETGPGRFTVQGKLWRIMRGLDRFFHVYALSLGAVEQHHPTTVPVASMIETGYLGTFPQHALLVSTFHNELDNLAAVAAAPAESFSRLAPPGQMLAPTVCFNCFEALRGQTLLEEALFTALGYCHRDEGPIRIVLLGEGRQRYRQARVDEWLPAGNEPALRLYCETVLQFRDGP